MSDDENAELVHDWESDCYVLRDEITRLRAENERLREALRPFAEEFSLYKTDFPDHFYISDLGFTFGQLRAAAAALEGVTEPASPWRDIESAPRDGTYIDLWVNDERIPDARWNDCRRQWEVWDTGDYDRMEFIPIAGNPTHWMPLPEPPR